MNRAIRERLLELVRQDDETRARLVHAGELFDGYHAEMERVHLANAAVLTEIVEDEIIEEHGWPGFRLVGEDGAAAAWRIAQHAISCPGFQRECLARLTAAVDARDASPRHRAYLEDRICFNERRPQRYGTIFDWDEHGEMGPWRIEDGAAVDDLRYDVGLPPLDDVIRDVQRSTRAEGGRPPPDHAAYLAEVEAWAKSVGWCVACAVLLSC